MIQAAREAREYAKSEALLVGVTVLTSLDENNINYNKPSRISKENSQFKEAQKLKAEYLINADEDTIKNLVTNDIKEFDIEVIREH